MVRKLNSIKNFITAVGMLLCIVCLTANSVADTIPSIVVTNFTAATGTTKDVLLYRNNIYYYKGPLKGVDGSRIYSDFKTSRNIYYDPSAINGKRWMISGTWQWATNDLTSTKIVFNDKTVATLCSMTVKVNKVLMDDVDALIDNPAFSNAVVRLIPQQNVSSNTNNVIQSTLSQQAPFDFSTNAGLYLAISNLIYICGGSVTNFPAIQ